MYIAGVASRKRMKEQAVLAKSLITIKDPKVKMKIDYDYVAEYNEKLYVEERQRQRQNKTRPNRFRNRFEDNESPEREEPTTETNNNVKKQNFFSKKAEPEQCNDIGLNFDFTNFSKENPYLTDEMKSHLEDDESDQNVKNDENNPDILDTNYNTVQTETNLLDSEFPLYIVEEPEVKKITKKGENSSMVIQKSVSVNNNIQNDSEKLSKSQVLVKSSTTNLFANQNQNVVNGSSDSGSSSSDVESYETSSGSDESDEEETDSESSPTSPGKEDNLVEINQPDPNNKSKNDSKKIDLFIHDKKID